MKESEFCTVYTFYFYKTAVSFFNHSNILIHDVAAVSDVHSGLSSALVPSHLTSKHGFPRVQGSLIKLSNILLRNLHADAGSLVTTGAGHRAQRIQCSYHLVQGQLLVTHEIWA